jgi:hypothetical protein
LEGVRDPLRFTLKEEVARLLLLEDFRLGEVFMMLRTAATRSELIPRIRPISSGVGTGLPITYALMRRL